MLPHNYVQTNYVCVSLYLSLSLSNEIEGYLEKRFNARKAILSLLASVFVSVSVFIPHKT